MLRFRSIFSLFFALCTLLTSCGGSKSTQVLIGVDATWFPIDMAGRDTNVTAFSTELLTEIGKLQKLHFTKVTVNWDNLLDGLNKQQYPAMLSSIPPYPFNLKIYDFSDPYLPLGLVLVVPASSPIQSLDMLSGKLVAYISGSQGEVVLQKATGVLPREYSLVAKALSDVATGTIDGAIINILPAAAYVQDVYQGKLRIATAPLTEEALRLITLHNADPALIQSFNDGLKKLKTTPAYTALLKKWNLVE